MLEHQNVSYIPVILLTGKSDEIDTVLGLELGADDYIPKPFRKRELIARLNVLFRRIETDFRTQDAEIRFDNIVVKTINPKTTFERPKGMCAGDPYC